MSKNKNRESVEIKRVESEDAEPRTDVSFVGAARNQAAIVTNLTLMDEIAKSKYIIRNVTYPQARELFPHQPQHQTVGRFFPIAEGGALYVDDCLDVEDVPACELKRKHFKKLGFRYLVLKKDTDIMDAANQLGLE